jgi:tRNA pseudouridine55 synthase
MNGKRYYEYAREGKPLPEKIPARPVRTEMLELVDFTYDHEYELLGEEKLLVNEDGAQESQYVKSEKKRSRSQGSSSPPFVEAKKHKPDPENTVATTEPDVSTLLHTTPPPTSPLFVEAKEHKPDPENTVGTTEPDVSTLLHTTPPPASPPFVEAKKHKPDPENTVATTEPDVSTLLHSTPPPPTTLTRSKPEGKPLAITLSMTVTSGFYVRSLVNDLARELGSVAYMVKLVRTRQGEYELGGDKVLEWEDFENQPEPLWGPKVERILNLWAETNPIIDKTL